MEVEQFNLFKGIFNAGVCCPIVRCFKKREKHSPDLCDGLYRHCFAIEFLPLKKKELGTELR